MAERSIPAASDSQDPPWPTLHPADDYDGDTHEPEEGGDTDDGDDGDDRRMHEQLGIANNEHPGEAPDGPEETPKGG